MKPVEISLLIAATWCGANSVFAQTWMQTSAPSNHWQCIASSADGSQLVAGPEPGPIYISTNSGSTWSPTITPNEFWSSVASSADGTKLIAAAPYDANSGPGGVYTSTNAGLTWISNNLPNEYWNSVASSADGAKFVVVAPQSLGGFGPGAIFTSTNSGSNWASNSLNNVDAYSVASSADGTKLILVGSFGVWRSTNCGATWTQDSTAPIIWQLISPAQFVASSADGTRVALVLIAGDLSGNPGPIYTSTNSGDTWELTAAPSNQWACIASSADGKTLLAAPGPGQPGPIYVSTNAGVTWTSNNSPSLRWGTLASSADGGKLVAAAEYDVNHNGNWIYASQSVQPPLLDVAPANGNLNVSWIVPSTHFALQENSDLTTASWTDVTNSPVLNLTNLHNEVVLPPPGSSVFFRLKTP